MGDHKQSIEYRVGLMILEVGRLALEGNFQRAEEALEAFRKEHEDRAPWVARAVLMERAWLLRYSGDPLGALELYRLAKIEPNERSAYILNASIQGRILTELGHTDEALKTLRSAVLQAQGPADQTDLHVAIQLLELLPDEEPLPEWFVELARGALREWAVDATGGDLAQRDQLTELLAQADAKARAPKRAEEAARE
jgi:tetratricopeptide (TPR) repeat protein